jgi:hypothetical protein
MSTWHSSNLHMAIKENILIKIIIGYKHLWTFHTCIQRFQAQKKDDTNMAKDMTQAWVKNANKVRTCTSYLIYNKIWVNVPREHDRHFSTSYGWLPFTPHKEYYIKNHWPITMNSKHLKWANHTRGWFIHNENDSTIRRGNTYDTPLLIGFQVKSYFTLHNSKYKILDSRIRLKWIPHNGHYKNQWDKFFHNNILMIASWGLAQVFYLLSIS